MLEPIQSYCLDRKLLPLTILVVNKNTGLPGAGFTAASAPDLAKKQLAVFTFDWLEHGCPKPEALKDAADRLPSNGQGSALESSG